jgi:hypothetical protein
MIPGMKKSTIVAAWLSLAFLCWICWRLVEPATRDEGPAAKTSAGPSFRARMIMPPMTRAVFGLLPNFVEDRLPGAMKRELLLDHTSPDTELGRVGPRILELRNAAGWDLSIETDAEGRIAGDTRVYFPINLGERDVRLVCRPVDPAVGHLKMEAAEDGRLSGSFQLEIVACLNAKSGKRPEWPPAPLKLRGSFAALPPGEGFRPWGAERAAPLSNRAAR